jgi:serine/threonine protein phosphatase PrpC
MSSEKHSPRSRSVWSPLLAQDGFPPLSAQVQVEFGARTRGGRLSHPRADHFLIVRLGRHQETLLTSLRPGDVPLPFDEFGYGMLVADGSGEAASRLALSTLAHMALHFGKWSLRLDVQTAREVMERVERYYQHVDGVVGAQSQDGLSQDMHTTLTGLFSAGSDCIFAHVGHSRAYLFRAGQVVQMTRDHAVSSGAERPPGVLPPPAHDLAHMLTEVIGGSAGPLVVDVERFHLLDRDALLLCTNGLTDVVPDDRIRDVLMRPVTPDEQCQELVELAQSAGGQDDVTVLIARYQIPA